MTLLDLIEKDINWIKEYHKEFYKNIKYPDFETLAKFLKKVFEQNVSFIYTITTATVNYTLQSTHYILLFGDAWCEFKNYALEIYEDSLGHLDLGVNSSDWEEMQEFLNIELKTLEINYDKKLYMER